jgi:predicted transposase YdaD
MPKFNKTREELVTMYDKWLFVLKNLSKLMERPKELQERIFERVFKIAEISMLSEVEHLEYEESLNALWDITNAMEDSEKKGFFKGKEEGEKLGLEKGLEKGRAEGLEKGRAEGRAEGIAEGEKIGLAKGILQAKIEAARNMKAIGTIPIDLIIQATGLTKEEILKL